MIPMAAIPMETEVVITTPDSSSLLAAEGDTGHELRIPVSEDETVTSDLPDNDYHGNGNSGGLFVGLETSFSILARSYLKFDKRSYPADIAFQSAYLYVHMNVCVRNLLSNEI
jgi:hypothetical protein